MEAYVGSLIAVTGLAGHAFGSWRNRESDAMWLQDFLPRDVKTSGVRISTFGYNSALIGERTAEGRILDYARQLIKELEVLQSVSNPSQRKLTG